jgi:hypothetical protein
MGKPKVTKKKYRVKMVMWVDVWAENEDEAYDKAYDEEPSDYDWEADDIKETDESYEDDIIPDDVEKEDF